MVCLYHNLIHSQQNNTLLQNIESREKVSLNGTWNIIIDPLETGYYSHRYEAKNDGYFKNAKVKSPSELLEYDFDKSYQLNVPGDWNTQMEKLYYYEGTIWYKKSFDFKKNENTRNYLYFEAVNYEALVYLNGELLGSHVGGYTPFQFDVTDKLKSGDNFVVVKVDNTRKREAIPTINTDWWNYGGITRSVHVISTPNTHIEDYSIGLSKGSINNIEGWVVVKNAKDGQIVNLEIPEAQKES